MTLKQDNPLSGEVEAEIDEVLENLWYRGNTKRGNLTIAKSKLTKLLLEQRIEAKIESWQKVLELYEDNSDEQFHWECADDFGEYAKRQIAQLTKKPRGGRVE